MRKLLYISLLLVFVTSFSRLHAYYENRSLVSALSKTRIESFIEQSQHSSSELHHVSSNIFLACRVTPVQKDTVDGFARACHLGGISILFSNTTAIGLRSFFKNYIDHIYPSHHFW